MKVHTDVKRNIMKGDGNESFHIEAWASRKYDDKNNDEHSLPEKPRKV